MIYVYLFQTVCQSGDDLMKNSVIELSLDDLSDVKGGSFCPSAPGVSCGNPDGGETLTRRTFKAST